MFIDEYVVDFDIEYLQNSGLVGLFFDATYIEKIIVLGAPAAHSQQSSLNIMYVFLPT